MSAQQQVEMYLPTNQLGLQVGLGTEGPPSGRVLLSYGTPHQGKSSISFQFGSDVIEMGGSVDIIETENALDKDYAGTFFYRRSLDINNDLEALLTFRIKLLEKDIKTWKKESNQIKVGNLIKEGEKRLPLLNKLLALTKSGEYPYPKNKIILKGQGLTRAICTKLTREALAEYRLQSTRIIQTVKSLEQLESKINEIIEERKKLEDFSKPHFIIVDSVSALFPENDLEKTHSSDGNHFGPAKFLAQWVPKISSDLMETNVTISFVAQQNAKIKMSMFERSDKVLDVTFRGGSAIKFAASIMMGVIAGKEITDWDGNTVKTGKIQIHKQKQLGGGIATLGAEFYLRKTGTKTEMDFEEPFFEKWLFSTKQKTDTTCEDDPQTRIIKGHGKLGFPAEFAKASELYDEEAHENLIKPLSSITGGKYVGNPEDGFGSDELFIFGPKDEIKRLIATSPYIHQIIKDNRNIACVANTELDDYSDLD